METEKLETVTVFYKMVFINKTVVTNRQQCQTAIHESEELMLNGVNILIFFFSNKSIFLTNIRLNVVRIS